MDDFDGYETDEGDTYDNGPEGWAEHQEDWSNNVDWSAEGDDLPDAVEVMNAGEIAEEIADATSAGREDDVYGDDVYTEDDREDDRVWFEIGDDSEADRDMQDHLRDQHLEGNDHFGHWDGENVDDAPDDGLNEGGPSGNPNDPRGD